MLRAGALVQGALLPAEIPTLYRVNDHVVFGYKEFRLTTRECLRSIVHTNNETVNVWTSFLIVIHSCAWTFAILTLRTPSPYFQVVLLASTLCRCACWLLSALAHAFSTHESADIVGLVWRLDYVGIYLCIMGMCNAGTYVELAPVFPGWVWKSCIAVGTAGCGLSALYILQKGDAFHLESYRAWRTAPFAAAVAIYLVPYLYKLAVHGPDPYTPWLCATICAPLVGAAFFVPLWPEKHVRTPWVHTWCLSHHLWHWANVLGDVFYHYALWKAA
jgi:predicted membrane channel-forming protein YqfA (hemolysin III family)